MNKINSNRINYKNYYTQKEAIYRINSIYQFFRLTSSKLFKPFNPITNKQHFEYESKYNLPCVKLGNKY